MLGYTVAARRRGGKPRQGGSGSCLSWRTTRPAAGLSKRIGPSIRTRALGVRFLVLVAANCSL